MVPEKVINFLASNEFYQIVEDCGKFLGISWGEEKMVNVLNLVFNIFELNLNDKKIKDSINEYLDFLTPEQAENFYNYFIENYILKLNEIWQEEEQEVSFEEEKEVSPEETFTDREKRYLEMMKEILKLSPLPISNKSFEEKNNSKNNNPETTSLTEDKKELVQNDDKNLESNLVVNWQEKEKEEIPEGSITFKKEEKKIDQRKEDFLDLSNL